MGRSRDHRYRPIIEVIQLVPGIALGTPRAVRPRGDCGLAGRRSGLRPGDVPRARPGGPPSGARGRDIPAAVRVPVPGGHGDAPPPAGCGRTWLTSLRV